MHVAVIHDVYLCAHRSAYKYIYIYIYLLFYLFIYIFIYMYITRIIINNNQSQYCQCKKSAQYYSRENYAYSRIK